VERILVGEWILINDEIKKGWWVVEKHLINIDNDNYWFILGFNFSSWGIEINFSWDNLSVKFNLSLQLLCLFVNYGAVRSCIN